MASMNGTLEVDEAPVVYRSKQGTADFGFRLNAESWLHVVMPMAEVAVLAKKIARVLEAEAQAEQAA